MKSVKLAVIAALSSFAVSAFALSPMQDTDLSAVSGQDGVSIAADLNIKIASFEYTAKNGAVFGAGEINVNGSIAATIDVMNNVAFAAPSTGEAFTVLGVTGGAGLTAFAPGDTDAVVKIAVPKIDVSATHKLNISVADMKVGSVNVGKMAINDLQLQGTTAYIWARKSY